ncbi:hypothetical protein GY45DRAFT_1247927 [Cubamyces sp. BRFM 1775]|nr:hypothetical protein GY45DRAFT_1247927 [Cubamyces sp. BRFM 1775]
MYSTLVSVALFSALAIQGALADFTVVTPSEMTQCDSIQLQWDSTGAKTYDVAFVDPSDPCGTTLQDFGDDHTTNHITVKPAVTAGTKVMISVIDSDGQEGWSGEITVKAGNDTSCVPGAASSAASTKASSTAASETATSGATSGTTLTVPGAAVNPEADPTGTSATSVPSGNGGATAVGAANEGILGGSNGALASVKFSASALFVTVLGAVAAVAL